LIQASSLKVWCVCVRACVRVRRRSWFTFLP